MVVSAPSSDPTRLAGEVPTWIANTRKEAHRALGEVEIGVRRAVEEAASAIAARSRFDGDRETMPTIDEIQEDSVRFLGNVGPILDALADRMVHVLGAQLRPLDRLAAEASGVPEASLRAARAGWDRAIRAYAAAVGQYVAGFVEGGGIAFALWTELPPELAGHTGEVATILAERLSIVTLRAEAVVSRWIAEVQRELEDLLVSLSPAAPPTLAERLDQLMARAAALGVRVRSVPDVPTDRWVERLQTQLREVEARSAERAAAAELRRSRLDELLALASRLRVRVQQLPDAPSDRYLDRMQVRLVEIATRKGVALPPGLGGPTPQPAVAASDEATQEIAPKTDAERQARVEALVARAAEAALDLGRVPTDPTLAWIVVTEAKLEAAIQSQQRQRRSWRKTREAERRARIERLHHQADQLGVQLSIPPFPTDDWLDRAELRIAALVLTPAGGAPSDAGRAERFNRVYAAAAALGLSLGSIPPDPDDVWLGWAEAMISRVEPVDATLAADPDPDERPGAVLVFEEGTIQEHSFAIGDQPFTLGRGKDNDVQIRDDTGVSRKHCAVRCEGGRYVVRDTGSTKGTYVDGQRVQQAPLVDGAVLGLGDTQYVFRLR
jgi:hypothetical protein